MHKSMICLTMTMSVTLVSIAQARTFEPGQGWGDVKQTEKAIEYAGKKDLPVALVYFMKSSDCPKCVGPQTRIQNDKTLNKMPRVMVFNTDAKPAALTAAQRESGEWSTGTVHIVDGDKNLLAVAADASQLKAATSQATKIISWQRKVDSRLKAALSQAERGLYDKALKSIEEIENEDKTLTNNLIQKFNDHKKEKFKQAKADNPQATEASFGIKKDEEIEEAPGKFFVGLMDEYRPKVEELANKALEEAKAAYEKEDFLTARRLLAPMIRNECEFDAVTEAKELIKAVEADHKAKMQSARN